VVQVRHVLVLGPQGLQELAAAAGGQALGTDFDGARLPGHQHVGIYPLVGKRGREKDGIAVFRLGLGAARRAQQTENAFHGVLQWAASQAADRRKKLRRGNRLQPGKLSGILALLRASCGLMMLRRTRSVRFWSSVCMPTLLLVWMVEYI